MAGARRRTADRAGSHRIQRLLVVCHGNIYRSAFVGQYLKQCLQASCVVRSGGFHRVAGRPAPERHVLLSRRYGVELADHRSTVVQSSDIDWADAILLMDSRNWQALIGMNAPTDRIIWLGAMDGGDIEIPDPDTLSDEQLAAVVGRLHDCAKVLAAQILADAGSLP